MPTIPGTKTEILPGDDEQDRTQRIREFEEQRKQRLVDALRSRGQIDAQRDADASTLEQQLRRVDSADGGYHDTPGAEHLRARWNEELAAQEAARAASKARR